MKSNLKILSLLSIVFFLCSCKTQTTESTIVHPTYRYFFQVTNVDNTMRVRCNSNCDQAIIEETIIFPQKKDKNYFDYDPQLNITREFTDAIHPKLSNKIIFECSNGISVSEVHLRYKIYYKKYLNGKLEETKDIIPYVDRLEKNQPANQLSIIDSYSIEKRKPNEPFVFILDKK